MAAEQGETSFKGYVAELFDGIQGEGLFAGYHHAFIRLSGCSLGCTYCDTEYAQQRVQRCRVLRHCATVIRELANPVGVPAVVEELRLLLETSKSVTAISVTGGEPLEQPHFLRYLINSLKSLNLPVHLETSGAMPDELGDVLDLVDVISADIKLPSTSGRDDLWERSALFLKKAHKRFVFVKIAINELTETEEVGRAASIVSEVDEAMPVFLQPAADKAGVIAISSRRIMELYEVCTDYLRDVRVMPQIHKVIGSP